MVAQDCASLTKFGLKVKRRCAFKHRPSPHPDSMEHMPKTSPNLAFQADPHPSLIEFKLCPQAHLLQRVSQLARPLVFTNGVFDVLHRGHVMYLEQARALGGSLLVALNTDASARRLGKGDDRPLNQEYDRGCIIAALSSTNLVTWFDEDTPEQLLDQVRPDIYVKGGDYDMSQLAETALMQSWGGDALALPFVAGYSTTALVSKIRQTGT